MQFKPAFALHGPMTPWKLGARINTETGHVCTSLQFDHHRDLPSSGFDPALDSQSLQPTCFGRSSSKAADTNLCTKRCETRRQTHVMLAAAVHRASEFISEATSDAICLSCTTHAVPLSRKSDMLLKKLATKQLSCERLVAKGCRKRICESIQIEHCWG